MREAALLEVMPEARERRHVAICSDARCAASIGRLRLRRAQLGFDGLASRKLLAIELDEVRTSLAIFELAREIHDELFDELATELPQPAQLIEHERGIAAVLRPEPLLERRQHFLHARRGAFLLLDAVLETIDFVLELAVGFSSAPRDS